MKKLSPLLLVLASVVAVSGCRTKDCVDGSIFATVRIGAVAAAANHLEIVVKLPSGAPLSQGVDITPGTGDRSVAITFGPSAYPAGLHVTVAVTASLSGNDLASDEKDIILSGSCGRLELELGTGLSANGDGGSDGPDIAGCITDALMCTTGQCGRVPDGCGGFVNCDKPCNVTQVHPRLATAGDIVTLEGTFAPGATIDFAGAAATPLTIVGSHRATVAVPNGAKPGLITVHSGNQDLAAGLFRRATFPLGLQPFTGFYTQASYARMTPTFNTPRKNEALVAHDAYLYSIGGSTSTNGVGNPSAVVEGARINADATVAAAQNLAASQLNAARYGHCAIVVADKLVVVGGAIGTASLRSLEWATIKADGTLSAFTLVPDVLAKGRAFATCHVVGDQLYVVGGIDNTLDLVSIEQAPIATDGMIGTFTMATATLATPRHGHAGFVTGSKLLIVGGNTGGGATANAEIAPIDGEGVIGAFTASPNPLPSAASDLTSVQWGNKLYALPYISTVDADGVPGAFTDASAGGMQNGYRHTDGTRVVVARDRLYMVSSSNSDQATYDLIVSAPLDTAATLGAFSVSAASALPEARSTAGVIVHGNNLYLIGGQGPGGAAATIYRAPIALDDTVGTFVLETTQLPAGRSEFGVAVANDHIYLLGGAIAGANTNTIIDAPINADGTIGAFVGTTTALGAPTTLLSARRAFTTYVIGNNLCVAGGYIAQAAAYSAGFECAQIGPSGALSAFSQPVYFGNATQLATLTTARAWHSGALVYSSILAIGGANSSPPNNVESAAAYYASPSMADKFVPVISPLFSAGARSQMSALVVGTGVYLLGGFPTTAATARINALTLNAAAVTVPASDLKVARYGESAVLIGNQAYVLGGIGGSTLASIESAPLQ